LYDVDTIKWKFQATTQSEIDRNFHEIANLKKKHAEKEYLALGTESDELYSLNLENINQFHPFELTNMKAIHELEQQHLSKQQWMESRQQQELITSDHKTSLSDFNKKKISR